MDERKEQTDTTDNLTDTSLIDPVTTEPLATTLLPETSAPVSASATEEPKNDAPVTLPTEPDVTTASPVTTSSQDAEPMPEYMDDVLFDLMYETDGDGNWTGFGKYIANYENLEDITYLTDTRSREAYDEVMALLNGETQGKEIADIYDEFRSDVKLILRVKGVEFTINDVLGYEILKLQ